MIWSLSAVAAVLGWLGAAGSMSAYWLVSSGRVAPDSLRYHALNIIACALLAVACATSGAWPSVVTNLLFIAIGVHMTWKVRARLAARVRALWHERAARGPLPATRLVSQGR